jgi:hypothetical protein
MLKYVPFFRTTMPAAPARPCGTASLIEYAPSPTPETEVAEVADFRALSKVSLVPRAAYVLHRLQVC